MKKLIVALVLALMGTLPAAGCSSSKSADCGPCITGNECISDGKITECRLTCPLIPGGLLGGQATCPMNYHCVDAAKPYCAKDAVAIQTSSKGLWGAPCSPKDGFDNNPACDTDQNFWCYGASPTDGAAFCTQYDCADDTQCKGGWSCATINAAPNVVQAARSVGQTRTACLPRTYCSSCKSDIDCPPSAGLRQHCIADSGGAKYCTPECQGDTQCNQEAKCVQNDQAGTSVCVPNAGVCVGDGGFCSPCHSDGDCKNGGACAGSAYSTEHFCTIPNGVPCTLVDGATANSCKLVSTCPKNSIAGGNTSCSFTARSNTCSAKDAAGNSVAGSPNQWPNIPFDFCYGEVKLADGNVPGCWTTPR